MPHDTLKLHFIILLWGSTAVLGALIDLPPAELVAWRTAIAALALAIILRQRLLVPRRDALLFVATGALIGVHWMLFFLAVKVANVSICMARMATVSLWTAVLEPLMIRGRKLNATDLLFSSVIIGAVYLIFRSELDYSYGFIIALASAFAATVFSIINGAFAKRFHHRTIACYEMIGACLICIICLPISDLLSAPPEESEEFRLDDLVYLLTLALACTVYSFSEYVELLKRLTVFSVNLATNLEPVYGIALGAIVLRDYRHLSTGFYAGAAIIATAVIAYPTLKRLTAPGGAGK